MIHNHTEIFRNLYNFEWILCAIFHKSEWDLHHAHMHSTMYKYDENMQLMIFPWSS